MIQLTNIDKQFGAQILYKDASITFHKGNRYGIIGHNGAGKSVLLRMIVGEDSPNKGVISIAQECKIAYLPQEAEENAENSPLDTVLEPFLHLLNYEEQFALLAETHDMDGLAHLQDQLDHYDIYTLPSRAKSLLAGLGVPQDNWDQPMELLSGGFRMRVLLAQLILTEPDFLIMDEPTNHLDMNSLIWLERFLARFNGGLIVISHDRGFLNRTITHTVEVAGQRIISYKGNLNSFETWKELQEESEARQTKNLLEKIEANDRFIERFRSKATKAVQAQARMKANEKLKAQLPPDRIHRKELNLTLPAPTNCGATPFRFNNVVAGYDENIVLNGVNLTIAKGERIAIIGPNGAGKSTLLKTCAKVLTPMSGEVILGHNAEIRFFSQHRVDSLNEKESLYDTISHGLGENRPTEIRKYLGSFLFSGDEVFKEVGVCSGGEKSRISLLLMMVKPGNTLLLDEPTNHLDMSSIDTISTALAEYDGTILFVSHDEFFINKIATRIIEVTKEGIRDFPGTLDEYRETILSNEEDSPKSGSLRVVKETKSLSKADRMAQREEKKKLTRTNDKIEKAIAEIEIKIAQYTAQLHHEEVVQNHDLLIETQATIDTLVKENDALTLQWEEIQEKLERLA